MGNFHVDNKIIKKTYNPHTTTTLDKTVVQKKDVTSEPCNSL